MKNFADLRGSYQPRPSASVDNALLNLQNSSYPTQPHSIIAKYLCKLLLAVFRRQLDSAECYAGLKVRFETSVGCMPFLRC